MLNMYKFFISSSLCLAVLLSPAAQAESFMSGDKISALITDKTIHATHLIKNFDFKVYFANDGKAFRTMKNGDVVETTYRLDGKKHCLYWRGKDRCAKMRDNGDGTYARVNKKGKQVVMWTKIEPGKNL